MAQEILVTSPMKKVAPLISDEGVYNYMGTYTKYIFDVVSTSLCKVRFIVSATNAAIKTLGSSTADWTGVMFTRLGDT